MKALQPIVSAAVGLTPGPLVRLLGRPYIAGPELEDALAVAARLAGQGALVTLDRLGEGEVDEAGAEATVAAYERALARLAAERPGAGVSVKLSALGQAGSEERCGERLIHLLEAAAAHERFVRVDMEDSSTTDSTLRVYRRAREAGYANVGVVLQAALRRSAVDARALAEEGIADVRICKGIYVEPAELAHRSPDAIRTSYLDLAEIVLGGGGRAAFATHDDALTAGAGRIALAHDPERERHEYQTLLGVRPELVERLLAAGERVRVYLPYGHDAERYATRRVQENPRIALQVLGASVPRLLGSRTGRR